jgi:hypothetical protein
MTRKNQPHERQTRTEKTYCCLDPERPTHRKTTTNNQARIRHNPSRQPQHITRFTQLDANGHAQWATHVETNLGITVGTYEHTRHS